VFAKITDMHTRLRERLLSHLMLYTVIVQTTLLTQEKDETFPGPQFT